MHTDKEEVCSMGLSTVDERGRPRSRMVLFKGMYDNQLSFFTNYNSQKARELDCHPRVALLFHWKSIDTQIRIEGEVKRAPREYNKTYWNTRPFEKQLSGAISDQSKKINFYEDLVKKYEKLRGNVTEMLCPDNWGGYLIKPDYFEFWEASPIRLHKRTIYEYTENGLETYNLQP